MASKVPAQQPGTSGDACAVCCGTYVNDIIDDETGEVTTDWVQCADPDCALWNHVDCLEKEMGEPLCEICGSLFN